jgi:hypothetical protein
MPGNTPESAQETASLDETNARARNDAIKATPADEREARNALKTALEEEANTYETLSRLQSLPDADKDALAAAEKQLRTAQETLDKAEAAYEPFRQARNTAASPSITNAEHIEELRQELKPGALADPAERAAAETQLQLALNAAPSDAKGTPRDPREILEELKRAVRDKAPTATDLEYEYIGAVHGYNPAHSLSDSPANPSRPAPANEIDALRGLKTAYENFEVSRSASEAAFAKLEAGLAQNKDLPEVDSLIKDDISAQEQLASHTIALFEADADYKPFRQAHDQSSAPVPPEHQALKSLVSAYEQHDNAKDNLAAKRAFEAPSAEIEKAPNRLDQAAATLNAAKAAYQPYEAAKSAASQQPASNPPAANTTEIDGYPRANPENAQTNPNPAAASATRTQVASTTAAPGGGAHAIATAEPQNKSETQMGAFNRDDPPQTPEPNSGAPNRTAPDRPPQTAHSIADASPPPAARAPATTDNNSSPARQSPASQTAPRGQDHEAEQEPDADTEANTQQTVTFEKTNYQIRPVFGGGPFSNLFRKAWKPTKEQSPEPSTQQANPQTTAERKPQTAANRSQTSLGSRLGGYTETRRQPERDTEALQDTHAAAKDAITAINDFRATQGAVLLNKIQDAAATTKGGIREVLSEMRTNGAYENLRKEFDALYNQNAAFRGAYDRATSALTEYGDRRGAVAPTIHNQPQNPIAGKIKALDEEIAKATADIPGATEGQSITEKLAEKAREIVDAILEKLRNTFNRNHDPSPSPAPSPSP